MDTMTVNVGGRRITQTWDLEVLADDDIGNRVIHTGLPYEYTELIAVRSLVHRNKLVVDVGANVGNHSLFWAVELGAQVLAFEPNSAARAILARNVARNCLESSITIMSEALGESRGSGRITVPSGNLGAARVTDSPDGDIDVIPLDSLGLSDVSVIKIDVEGAERAVLQGASETIRRCRPTIWVELLDRESHQAVQAIFAGFGYPRYQVWLGETNAMFVPSARALLPILKDPAAMLMLARRQAGRQMRHLTSGVRRR